MRSIKIRSVFINLAIIFLIPLLVRTQDVPHEEIEFDCEVCHTSETFTEVSFDHEINTGFQLSDRHAALNCKSCHSLKDFSKVSKDCKSCHSDIHEAKHGTDCLQCHSTNGWQVFDIFQIHENTNFPIMGRHAALDCRSCHNNFPMGDLSHTDSRCVSCHQSDYLEISNPNHVAAGFSTDCEMCHQMNTFRPALLPDHDAFFPIYSGEHNGEWNSCNTCHTDPNNFVEFTCLVCHEHRQVEMDPKHDGIPGYSYNSPDCYLCHPRGTAESFTDHDAQFFPIFTGPHQGKWDQCATCHIVPTDRKVVNCLSCHEHRQSEMDGKHGSMSGYSYTSSACLECHPTGEKGQFIAHDAEFFPIFSGVHNNEWTECANCHTTPLDRSLFDCLSCHDQTPTDGIHTGMTGYNYASTACYDCHPTGTAEPFTDHDAQFFPIFSGTHNNEWTECANCHTTPLDRSVFDCLGCHEQTPTDGIHGSISGYNYTSTACYDCHPTGEKGEFTDHDAQFFPIFSGTHNNEWTECASCHITPLDRTVFDCLGCHEHRQTAMDGMHGTMTGYAYNSPDCLSCHPTGVKGTFFGHDAQFFPIFSGKHNHEWADCATCHDTPLDRSEFTCFNCHEHDQSRMDDKHLGKVDGYEYESSFCYDCHPNGNSN